MYRRDGGGCAGSAWRHGGVVGLTVGVMLGAAVLLACAADDSSDAAPALQPLDVNAPSAVADEDDDEPRDGRPDPEDDPTTPSMTTSAELVPGCTAKATVAGHRAWIFFTRPDNPCAKATEPRLDPHVLNELTRLIGSVPAGGRIDGHIFSISVDSVAKALLDAEGRGVEVWLSTDGGVGASTDPSKVAFLDKLKHKVYCTAANRSSCVSSHEGAISHTKLFVFSSATMPDGEVTQDVAWIASANQTYASGMRLYNNAIVISGDKPLYTRLRGYLDDLFARRTATDYYDPSSTRGHILATGADVYISPEAQTDLVVHRLDDITPDNTCEVRVLQASIRDSRLAVVNRLRDLKAGGCAVTVVAHTVEPTALGALKSAGIVVKKNDVHDKSFIVRARYGANLERRVYTGSHNLSGSANNRYDEIFVKLPPESETSHPVYDAYLEHFDDALAAATSL